MSELFKYCLNLELVEYRVLRVNKDIIKLGDVKDVEVFKKGVINKLLESYRPIS